MAEFKYLKIKMDSALHDRLAKAAAYNRRDIHNEVLWVIERNVGLVEDDMAYRITSKMMAVNGDEIPE